MITHIVMTQVDLVGVGHCNGTWALRTAMSSPRRTEAIGLQLHPCKKKVTLVHHLM